MNAREWSLHRRGIVQLLAVIVVAVAAMPAGATVLEPDPAADEETWPVLETAPPTSEADLPAEPTPVTDVQLAAAGSHSTATLVPIDSPNRLIVDDDRAQCPNAEFTSAEGIQLAVEAASPGDVVQVCPGVYDGFTVDKPLTLQAPRLQGTATQCQASVVADPTREAIVQGSRAGGTIVLATGPVVLEGFTAQDNPLAPGVVTNAGSSGYVIRHNVVQRNRNGIDVNSDGGVETIVAFNCVRSNGLLLQGAGTGIISSFGISNARIDENFITGHDCGSIALAGPASCLALPGLLPATTDVSISHNDVVDDSRIAIATGSNVTIDWNLIRLRFGPAIVVSGFGTGGPVTDIDVSFNHIDGQNLPVTQGIFITPNGPAIGSDVTVRANKVENLNALVGSLGSGVVFRAFRVEVHENWIENNRGHGIDVRFPSSESRLHGNLIVANGIPGPDVTDGVRVRLGAVANAIENNRLRANITHDCHDSNPKGANIWRHNTGETENQPGLCVKPLSS
jgi:hypothetical protein